ncbi:hypothetical protein QR680_006621 [Steinernema hermaphroditum]|uniref:RRM domain-containing protein n=1 Tax=Steinernema hermaphroditum TaxID=289476 RepID=A0AA39HW01_9BILA|nr:hypothetical protein QR680_006621 [Steinernema hermaphroditum]
MAQRFPEESEELDTSYEEESDSGAEGEVEKDCAETKKALKPVSSESEDYSDEEVHQEMFVPLTPAEVEAARIRREQYVRQPFSVRMAQIRASRELYSSKSQESGRITNPYPTNQRTIYVSNVPFIVKKHVLEQHFAERFGEVDYIRIPDGQRRGAYYAFVIFVHPCSASAAVDAEEEYINGQRIRIEVPKSSALRKTSTLFGAGEGESSRWAPDLRQSIEHSRLMREQEEEWS